jgi:hypothetical protein
LSPTAEFVEVVQPFKDHKINEELAMTKLEEFKNAISGSKHGLTLIAVLAALPISILPLEQHSVPDHNSIASITKSFSQQQAAMDDTKRLLEDTSLFLMGGDRYIVYERIFSNPGLDAEAKFEAVRNELSTDFGAFAFERDMKQTARRTYGATGSPLQQLSETVTSIKALDHRLFEHLHDETRPIDDSEKLKNVLNQLAAEHNRNPVKMAALK